MTLYLLRAPMTTSQTSFLSEVLRGEAIPSSKLAYFRGRLANRIHELVLQEFARQEAQGRISRAELARRIDRKPEQVTRWLGSPGNWTLETVSDLLLGMQAELSVGITSLSDVSRPMEKSNVKVDVSFGGPSTELQPQHIVVAMGTAEIAR